MTESITRSTPPARRATSADAGPPVDAELILRPAAVLPMASATAVLDYLELNALERGGVWSVAQTTGHWERYDRPSNGDHGSPGECQPIGTLFVTYGRPRTGDVELHRVQITEHGRTLGWTPTGLVDDVLSRVGLSMAMCPRDSTLSASGSTVDPLGQPDTYSRGAG